MRAVLFDAYGTLFRLDSIQSACAMGLAALNQDRSDRPSPINAETFNQRWRSKQLEISLHRSLMGIEHYVDFTAITAQALDFTLEQSGITLEPGSREALLRAWRTPAPDPAARDVLAALAGTPRAILSNGSPAMLAEACGAAGLTDDLAALLSADAVQVYKPHPRVYQLGVDAFGGRADEYVFVSANGWDAAGAAAFGYRVCWVNRSAAPVERHGPRPDWIVRGLDEVVGMLANGVAP